MAQDFTILRFFSITSSQPSIQRTNIKLVAACLLLVQYALASVSLVTSALAVMTQGRK